MPGDGLRVQQGLEPLAAPLLAPAAPGAVRRIPLHPATTRYPELRGRHPAVPRAKVIGLRNIQVRR